MKRVLALVLAASMLAGIGYTNAGAAKVYADEVITVANNKSELVNLLKNGDFSEGLTKWGNYTTDGGEVEVICEDGALKAKIASVGDISYGVQVLQNNFPLYKGGKYRLTFDISSTVDRDIYYCIQMNGGDYHAYVGDQIEIGADTKTVSIEFDMNEDTDLAPALAFNMGNVSGDVGEHIVTIDNVGVYLIDDSNMDGAIKENVNLIKNGDFSDGLTKWGSYTTDGGELDLSCEDEELKAKIINCGEINYGVQVSQNNFPLYKNGVYRISFDVSSTVDREIYYGIQMNGGDYRSYAGENVEIGPDKKKVTLDFTMNEESDMAPALIFNMGNMSGNLEEHIVTIDNVSVSLIDGSKVDASGSEEEKEQGIVLNQLGYLPNDSKKVVFRGKDLADKTFNVVKAETNEVVYTGEISEGRYNASSDEINYFGDFTDLVEEGTYKVITESLGESYEFKINKDTYKEALKDAVRFFYMQRCDELPEEYAGAWAHGKCHTGLARIYGTEDEYIDVSGGWHDAGDYGRYVVATSKAVADLVLAYEADKTAFGDDTNIPESGNGIADILDEVKGQLDWLFKMQNTDNGGVYHKVTCASFPGNIKADEEIGELIVTPISTTATGDFAAVMALGYDTFKTIDRDFADKCLEAAEKAWDYLDKQPSSTVDNPPGITTGAYKDSNDRDERYWAAAQLFKATGDEKYNEKIKKYVDKKVELEYGWQSVGGYGNQAYLKAKNADKATCNKIKAKMIKEADRVLKASKKDSYGIANESNFYWGSNMGIADQASLMEFVNKLVANPEYDEYAKEHINYFFGKNANAISFVSGYGTNAMKNPHHRPSVVAKQAIPGRIAGGVNSGLEDPYAEAYLQGKVPAKCYIDHADSYSTNEVDIYWNSALVRALASTKLATDDRYSDKEIQVTVDTNLKSGLNQNYIIKNNDKDPIDLSKIAIRYYYNTSNNGSMKFYSYHSGLNINEAPWYVEFTKDVSGTFGTDEKGKYVEVKINNPFELKQDMGELKLQTCIAMRDWSAISDFKDNGVVVLYDGKIVK